MDKETDVLTFLFNSAKIDSNQFYEIGGSDALLVANKLLKNGWIKDEIRSDGTHVRCAIFIEGIKKIDPLFIEEKTKQVLTSTGEAGTIWNVVEILKEKPEGYQFCFDLANEMQNRDLVKLLYSLYPSKVMIEMTLEGARIQDSEVRRE